MMTMMMMKIDSGANGQGRIYRSGGPCAPICSALSLVFAFQQLITTFYTNIFLLSSGGGPSAVAHVAHA